MTNPRLPRLRTLALCAAIVLVLPGLLPSGAAGTAAAASERDGRGELRLDATLRGLLARHVQTPQRVIIRVRPGGDAALRRALSALGGRVIGEHPSIGAVTAVVPGDTLGGLADLDSTLSISADAIVRPSGLLGSLLGVTTSLLTTVTNVILPGGADTSGPAVPPWVLRQTLGVDGISLSGRGVGVAVIDSGIEMSSEFRDRITAFYDMTGGRTVATSPFDDFGHGTHVAGTIGGSGALSRNADYHGLAPRVRFVILKVLDSSGAGYTSDVIRAIDFAVDNRARFGVSIINLSLGHPIAAPASADPLVQAVERASRAGLIVVVAAGNQGKNPDTGLPGYAGITSPGNAPSAITVGAARTEDTVYRSDDRIPDYSSAGPTWYDAYVKPDLVSPGHNIVAVAAKNSTLYKTYPQLRADDSDYMRLSGTSMATAVTTGSVALLLEANRTAYPDRPGLTPNAVKAILQYTSVGIHNDLGLEYDPLRKGAGALNGNGAIQLAQAVDTSAPVGAPWLTFAPSPWTSIGGDSLAWNQGVTWGSAVIWGSDIVWTEPDSWADAVIWGSDSIGETDGNAVIWGSTSGLTASSTAWKDVGGSSTDATAAGVAPQ